jgi:hypothetical protein
LRSKISKIRQKDAKLLFKEQMLEFNPWQSGIENHPHWVIFAINLVAACAYSMRILAIKQHQT